MKQVVTTFVIVFCFIKANSQITKGVEPSWISNVKFSKSQINKSEVSAGSYVLLYDTEINIPEHKIYHRVTTKVTDNVGIENASTVNVSYDPSYQKLKFHKINIIRDNKVIDKLHLSDFQVMRRELNAENYLYDGSLSAVMNVSDVRSGDIIDYSYSIIGFNPIYNDIFFNFFYLSDTEPTGKINITLLSKNKLNYKSFNTDIEPTISKDNGLYSYNWLNVNTKKLDYEDYTPAWKLLYESISVSSYNSWKDLVNWGVDVFKTNEKMDPELQAKIDEINNSHGTQGEKIKSTLDFVQNEIRYLGLESGIGNYKPFSPNQVFKQRFGDCKDKSLLMVTMLNQMNIEAYPMLVNTTLKQTIKDLLPSPKLFDHCVVKVMTNGGNSYWYDPTIKNQGGYYDNTDFPDYSYGLVLKKDNDSFDQMKPYSENKIETLEEFTIDTVGKGAILKVITTFHEGEADNMRNYFKVNSINSIKKEYEDFYSNSYYNATAIKAPYFEDQLRLNIFKVFEAYKLDSIWEPMPDRDNYIAATFTANSILNSIYIPNKGKRNSELTLPYPIIREHHIKINLPSDWSIKKDRLFVNSPGFYYEWQVDYDKPKKIINLNYYIKTQKDHISKQGYSKYFQDIKKVSLNNAYMIYIPKNFAKTSLKTSQVDIFGGLFVVFKITILIGALAALTLFLFWYFGNRKKTDS